MTPLQEALETHQAIMTATTRGLNRAEHMSVSAVMPVSLAAVQTSQHCRRLGCRCCAKQPVSPYLRPYGGSASRPAAPKCSAFLCQCLTMTATLHAIHRTSYITCCTSTLTISHQALSAQTIQHSLTSCKIAPPAGARVVKPEGRTSDTRRPVACNTQAATSAQHNWPVQQMGCYHTHQQQVDKQASSLVHHKVHRYSASYTRHACCFGLQSSSREAHTGPQTCSTAAASCQLSDSNAIIHGCQACRAAAGSL